MNLINEYIDSKRDEMISLLCKLIDIPSVKEAAKDGAPFGENNKKALDLFLNEAEKLGLHTESFDGYAGHAQTVNSDEADIGVLCHLDVVPAGDGWTSDPYKADIRNGRIYGRGATDDKGPTVAALYAAAAVHNIFGKQQDFHLTNKNIRLILGCDEESGGRDMDYYAKCAKMPKLGFAPDADFPVCNAEKGMLHLSLKKKSDKLGNITLHGGDRVNIVPELCRVSGIEAAKETGELCILGKAAHGSRPEQGKNAIFEALALCENEECRHIVELFSDYYGSGLGIKCKDKQSGPLTASLDVISLGGDEINMLLDVRYPVTATFDDVMGGIKKAASDYKIEIISHQAPLYIDENEPFIKCLLDAYSEVSGKEGKCYSMGGATFARRLPKGVAFGATFTDKPDPHIHAVDEFIEIDDLITSAKIYAQAIIKLCNL